MFKRFKRNVVKMFREILIYHNNSLEFRAKIFTLMIASDSEINECENKKLKEIACQIYRNDDIRADLLVDTVYEYCQKIKTKNGLDLEHLILLVEREARENRQFSKKIDIDMLKQFEECLADEEDKIFHQRILEYLSAMKEEYGTV